MLLLIILKQPVDSGSVLGKLGCSHFNPKAKLDLQRDTRSLNLSRGKAYNLLLGACGMKDVLPPMALRKLRGVTFSVCSCEGPTAIQS